MIRRQIHDELIRRTQEPRRFVQVLTGPRQVGKTTLIHQVLATLNIASHYATADEPALRDRSWLEQYYGAYPGAASLIGEPEFWGRLLESAAGAHLVNGSSGADIEISYWRERNQETLIAEYVPK